MPCSSLKFIKMAASLHVCVSVCVCMCACAIVLLLLLHVSRSSLRIRTHLCLPTTMPQKGEGGHECFKNNLHFLCIYLLLLLLSFLPSLLLSFLPFSSLSPICFLFVSLCLIHAPFFLPQLQDCVTFLFDLLSSLFLWL